MTKNLRKHFCKLLCSLINYRTHRYNQSKSVKNVTHTTFDQIFAQMVQISRYTEDLFLKITLRAESLLESQI